MQKTTALAVIPSIQLKFAVPYMLEDLCIIDDKCFQFPWTIKEFDIIRKRDALKVIFHKDYLVGYIAYALLSDNIEILKMAIHPECQRRGLGKVVLNEMKGKLDIQKRYKLETLLRERNVEAQLFFKDSGFVWTDTLEGYYHEDDMTEDAYIMEYNYR